MKIPLDVTVNRDHILGIVTALVAMIGGLTVGTMTRGTHLLALSILRPAESATRRLIAILAHGLVVPERAARSGPTRNIPTGKGGSVTPFPLFDPRRRVGPQERRVPGRGPMVWFLDGEDARYSARPEVSPDDRVDARALVGRIEAMMAALGDMERQAKRMARALARKTLPIRAMRPGRPPGHRAALAGGRYRHFVDEVLADCHELALLALNEPRPKAPP